MEPVIKARRARLGLGFWRFLWASLCFILVFFRVPLSFLLVSLSFLNICFRFS